VTEAGDYLAARQARHAQMSAHAKEHEEANERIHDALQYAIADYMQFCKDGGLPPREAIASLLHGIALMVPYGEDEWADE
jgi:predicted YcjX-like family ATPase